MRTRDAPVSQRLVEVLGTVIGTGLGSAAGWFSGAGIGLTQFDTSGMEALGIHVLAVAGALVGGMLIGAPLGYVLARKGVGAHPNRPGVVAIVAVMVVAVVAALFAAGELHTWVLAVPPLAAVPGALAASAFERY